MTAEAERNKIKAGHYTQHYNLTNLIDLLGTLNTPTSNTELQLLSAVKNLEISFNAAQQIIQNNQSVTTSTLSKIASSSEYRIDLYDVLKKAHKLSLFPAAYPNQKMFAASYRYSYVTDEDDVPQNIQFVAEKLKYFQGKQQKFYLFKITYRDADKSDYLGVVGPFAVDGKKITSENTASGICWDWEFSQKDINIQLNKYLKNF